jgi:hypothetical protein
LPRWCFGAGSWVLSLPTLSVLHLTAISVFLPSRPDLYFRLFWRSSAHIPASEMALSLSYGTAPVVYEYVWNVDDSSKQTSTYTTTYFIWPGSHTAYALVVNTAMPSPSQIETIGIAYTVAPGQTATQHVLATVATHSSMSSVLKTNHALTTPTKISSVQTTASPEVPGHKVVPGGATSSHESYSPYFQIILVCLFCGGYLWSRCRRQFRRRDSSFQERQNVVSSFEKSAIKQAV